jgi:GntR family phosphonate transport system transcriptional regulator
LLPLRRAEGKDPTDEFFMTPAPRRIPLWSQIATTLAAEIAGGRFAAGDRLPPEAQLAARFGVNRHTLRRALADLGARGIVAARRGAGVFVTVGRRIEYPLGRRVRFSETLAAQGARAQRQILATTLRRADPAEAAALGLSPGAAVHEVEGTSHADGVPVAAFRSIFPADRLAGLPAALRHGGSVTRALAACGVRDYVRQETEVTAETADAALALRLRIAEGAAVLITRAINVDAEGCAVELGLTWFAAERVTLRVGQPAEAATPSPAPAPSIGPDGGV